MSADNIIATPLGSGTLKWIMSGTVQSAHSGYGLATHT
jgi:hypothetical protein